MKKPRISFDKDAILGFLLNHCEKIVVGLIGLIGLGLAWGGVSAIRLKSVQNDQTPQAVSQLTAQAIGHIDAATKPPADVTRRGADLTTAIDPWRPQQVKVAPPPEMALFDRPIVEQLSKRAKPEVMPIEDLRAIAGVAVLPDPVDPAAMAPPGGFAPPGGRAVDGPAPDTGRPGRRPRPGARGEETPPEPPPAGEFGAGPMPTERAKVVPYVVVTGLVPVEKQRQEYQRAFGSAGFRDPQLDLPRWSIYVVERAAVGPAGAPPKWERLKVRNVESFGQGGGPGMMPGNQPPEPMQQETLPPTFLLGSGEADIGYVASVPQRLDEPWGLETVHPWFLPQLKKLLATTADLSSDTPAVPIDPQRLKAAAKEFDGQLGELAGMQLVGEPQRGGDIVAFAAKSADGAVTFPLEAFGAGDQPVFVMSAAWARSLAIDDGPRRDTTCTLRVRIEQLGAAPVAHILGITYPGKDGEPAEELLDPAPFPLAGAGMAMGGEFGGGRFVDGGGGGMSAGEEFRLFRFVDMNVKPGQTYRYRVRISLLNPNFGLPQQHLGDPTSAKGEWIVSKESGETAPVFVPDATRLLARTLTKDDVKQQKLKKDSLQILVLAPTKATGNYSLRSLITEVGGLANVDPALNKPGDARSKGEIAITDRVLVDVRGRQEESGKAGVPAETLEMLFLRPDGSFEFVNAADSQRFCERYLYTLDPPAAAEQPNPSSAEGTSVFEGGTPPRQRGGR